MTIRFRPRAREDIEAHVTRIGETNPRTAERFAERVQASCELLEQFPLLGYSPPWRELTALGVRFHAVRRFRKFLIVYRPCPDGIEVVRVFHGRRDLGALADELD